MRETQSDHRRYDLAALCLVVVALALRLVGLSHGLWYDEIETLVDHARLPMADIFTTYRSQNQHPFYGLLAHVALSVVPDEAAAVRLPAALFGAASVWAVYRFGRQVASPREGLLAALLFTVSYHHVWFSQNARGYTGLLCFGLLGSTALHQLLFDRNPSRSTAAWYALWMGLAAYTHVTAVFISIAHGLVVGWRWLRHGWAAVRMPMAGLAGSALVGAALYGPVIGQMRGTLTGPNPYAAETAWERPAWLLLEMARGLARGLPGGWIALGAGVLVATTGIVSFARRQLALAGLLVIPGAVTAAVVLATGHNLWPRFFFFAFGFAVLIAIRGALAIGSAFAGSRGERLATVALVLAALGSALTVPRAWAPKQDFGAAGRFIDERAAPTDAIATVDLTMYPYRFHERRPWPTLAGIADLDGLETRSGRVWVLTTFPIRLAAVQPGVWDRLRTRYDTAAVFPGTVGDGQIVIFRSRSRRTTEEKAP